MSQHLNSLSVGDTVDISGPAGKVVYLGRGYIRVKLPGKPEQIRFATDVGLIAGGTGEGSGRGRERGGEGGGGGGGGRGGEEWAIV